VRVIGRTLALLSGLAAACTPSSQQRVRADIEWLADPARGGRGIGSAGLEASVEYVSAAFRSVGLQPDGDDGTYRQPFELVTHAQAEASLTLDGAVMDPATVSAVSGTVGGQVEGPLVWVDYGMVLPDARVDDYAGREVRGRIAVVRRFAPSTLARDPRATDLRRKVWLARERGATAVVIVDVASPGGPATPEAPLPSAGGVSRMPADGLALPSVYLSRPQSTALVERLQRGEGPVGSVSVAVNEVRTRAANVVGRLPGKGPRRLPGVVVVGAHLDHLGHGGHGSMAPDETAVHPGADDNASGVAALVEIARRLRGLPLERDLVFVAFSAEEVGLVGSASYLRARPLSREPVFAMMNLDMVGRLRDDTVLALGGESAAEWRQLVQPACARGGLTCRLEGGGLGPSDHTSFFLAGVPVLHWFTGAHPEYHTPRDLAAQVEMDGVVRIAGIVADVAAGLAHHPTALTYVPDTQASFVADRRAPRVSLGVMPDYGSRPPGLRIQGVRTGSAAALAGLRAGDVVLSLGPHAVESAGDLMFALGEFEPGAIIEVRIRREGQELTVTATLQAGRHK
jgi:hypothetical protein